ncbi:MAG: hypothetical protein R3C58_08585 [Parvularculaceae bacterium]
MDGISTLRLQSAVGDVQLRHGRGADDPVHLMYVLENTIKREQYPDETEKQYLDFIKSELSARYADFIGKSRGLSRKLHTEYGQNLFDRYIACHGCMDRGSGLQGSGHPASSSTARRSTPSCQDRKPAGIANPKTSATRS